MSDLAEKPPELVIAEQLARIEETLKVHGSAIGLILGAATGGQVEPPLELFEKLGVMPRRVVPGIVLPQ